MFSGTKGRNFFSGSGFGLFGVVIWLSPQDRTISGPRRARYHAARCFYKRRFLGGPALSASEIRNSSGKGVLSPEYVVWPTPHPVRWPEVPNDCLPLLRLWPQTGPSLAET